MEEENFTIDIPEEDVKQIVKEPLKKVFDSYVYACPGSGTLLALKMCLQIIDNPVLVTSENLRFVKYPNSFISSMCSVSNVPAAATGISRSLKDSNVLCFADDISTKKNIGSLISSAERNDNFIYICCNSQRSTSNKIENYFPLFAETIRKHTYSATASVSHYEDFAKKLKKIKEMKGVRFIEVLCPAPDEWGFESSDTVDVARSGVETGIWPLFEVENGKTHFMMASKLEPAERYVELQKRFNNFSNVDIDILRKKIKENLGRLR